jgi:hypothetical protein
MIKTTCTNACKANPVTPLVTPECFKCLAPVTP